MEPIVETVGAATVASYLVAFFKLGFPSAPSWALVFTAIVAGVLSSVAVTAIGNGLAMTQAIVAAVAVKGIAAAAVAAGITRTDQAGEDKRSEALGR